MALDLGRQPARELKTMILEVPIRESDLNQDSLGLFTLADESS